jgi:hypothetical protein
MNLLDAICRVAGSNPWLALFVSCVLTAALLGISWAWAERLERAS